MQYAISILIALLSTVIFYGAPSLLLLKFRKRPIKIRDFRIFCILSTVCVWALFRVIFYLLGMEDSAHGKSGQMVSKMLQIWATKSRMIRINVSA